jgi:hypothetical protein
MAMLGVVAVTAHHVVSECMADCGGSGSRLGECCNALKSADIDRLPLPQLLRSTSYAATTRGLLLNHQYGTPLL